MMPGRQPRLSPVLRTPSRCWRNPEKNAEGPDLALSHPRLIFVAYERGKCGDLESLENTPTRRRPGVSGGDSSSEWDCGDGQAEAGESAPGRGDAGRRRVAPLIRGERRGDTAI